ncbi:MAG TPA: Uma2 family endonuclease [Thermoanaerobaculia bacterium]|nr:Uma2 family endonuclease [Thermoanaerobaculia bacterium]
MAVPLRKMPADWEPDPAPTDADPFRFGWRPKFVCLPGGEVVEQHVPLTAEDLLDPELGDETLVQGGPHAKFSVGLFELLERHFEDDTGVLVTFDMKMIWGIPGILNPAPDVAVIQGAQDKDEARQVFDVAREGTRPCLVIEVVSPQYEETRRNDYEKKVEIYERAGIPEYVIVEPVFVRGLPVRQLTGYRLGPKGRYQPIRPDAEGRLLSETTDLLFGMAEDRSLVVIDARTGERLLRPSQIAAAQEAAEERARVAEAEAAHLRAELDRLRETLPKD